MAKIIKHGNMYMPDKKITCRRCGCEFVAEKEDIHYPTIDIDMLSDDGNVHLSRLKHIKGLPKKNKNDRFYLLSEMHEFLTPLIVCPECGEPKATLQSDLVIFDANDVIWVTDDPILQEAIEKDTCDDDSPAWDVSMLLADEATYPCIRMDLRNGQFYPVNISVARPNVEYHDPKLYEIIKTKLGKS